MSKHHWTHCRNLVAAAVAGILAFASGTQAEDIDLYSAVSSNVDTPNLLIVIDNAANFSSATSNCTYSDGTAPTLNGTAGGIEQCALYNVINSLPLNGGAATVNVGIMMYNSSNLASNIYYPECAATNGEGGCLMRPITPMDASGKAALLAWIKKWQTSGPASVDGYVKANGEATAGVMQEAWAYYAGSDGLSTKNYAGIKPAAGCQKNFVVFIGNAFDVNGTPSDTSSVSPKANLESQPGITPAQTALITGTKTVSVCSPTTRTFSTTASTHENNGDYADEWARYMYGYDLYGTKTGTQNILTYTIGVLGGSCKPNYPALLSSMASVGGGKYYSTFNYNDLYKALNDILNEVQAVNSVFASASLPVSVNTQGTYLNQVYIGMFRPDASGNPRWFGNLKQYQFGFDANSRLVLTDSAYTGAAGNVATSAINPVTGFISPDATSFWSTNSPPILVQTSGNVWPAGGFWANFPQGANTAAQAFDAPDGEVVEKGGAAELLRARNLDYTYNSTANANNRNLLTCGDGSSNSTCVSALTTFRTDNTWLTGSSGIAALGLSSYTVTLTAGTTVTSSLLQKSGSNAQGTLGSGTIAANDYIYLSTSSQASYNCTTYNSNCQVASVSGSNFVYPGNISGNPPNDATARTIYKYGTTVTASGTGTSPFANGDGINLSSCTGTGERNLTAQLSGYNATVSNVSNGGGTFTFTFTVPSAALANTVVGSAISCSVRRQGPSTVTNLINWVRGYDNAGNETEPGPGSPVTIRSSVHGDVLHSRPAVVNYGGTTGVVVFYGANDGAFRAINGNQTNPTGSSLPPPGSELWGFIAPEFYGKYLRAYNNSPQVLLATTPGGLTPTPQPKDYFFDGSIGVLHDTTTSLSPITTTTAGKTYLYLSARRGGRFIYALDATNPTAPAYLWSKGCSSDSSTCGDNSNASAGDFGELGYTWSQPKAALIKGSKSGSDHIPVLIFAGGYDPNEDNDVFSTADAMGRGVYIVNAVTGALIWRMGPGGAGDSCTGTPCQVNITRAIPSDVTLVDRDGDALIDRLYVGDMGGNVWRVDLEPNGVVAPTAWTATKIASLGGAANTNNARKFMYPPDFVPTGAGYDFILIGSGDREHPLYTSSATAGKAYNVNNRFYVIKDTNTGKQVAGGWTPIIESNLFDATSTAYDSSGSGFYVSLTNTGEKVVNAPLVAAGKVYFGTNEPLDPDDAVNSCATLGVARGYQLDLVSGQGTSTVFTGGGLPPSPIAGIVTVKKNGREEQVPYLLGGGVASVPGQIARLRLVCSRWIYRSWVRGAACTGISKWISKQCWLAWFTPASD